jgi:hypothetical protein
VWAALGSTSSESLLGAAAIFGAAVTLLGVTLFKTEFGKAARRRRRLRQALARAERARAASAAVRSAGALTPTELVRLRTLRAKAGDAGGTRQVAGPAWWGKLRVLWRRGYAGLIVAVLIGAFSMATHFGAFWLIAGGGWPGAIAVTLLSTLLVVAVCIWIAAGLAASG